MSRWEQLGFTDADRKEVDALREGLHIKRYSHYESYPIYRTDDRGGHVPLSSDKKKVPDDMPIAPSKEEMVDILNSCAAMLGFKYV